MSYLATIPLFVLFFTLTVSVGASESGCTSADSSAEKVQGEGQKAYVDPETGALLSGPASGEPSEVPSATADASVPAEIQQQVQSDGAVVADIGDRFITELRVEIVDGKVVTCHRPTDTPQPSEPAAVSQSEKMSDDGS